MLSRISAFLKQKIDDISILSKIILSTFAIVIVFFSIIGYIAYYFSESVIREQAKIPVKDALDTVRNNIEIYLSNTVLTVNSIRNSIDVNDLFPLNAGLNEEELDSTYNHLMWDILEPVRRQVDRNLELQFVSFILDKGSRLSHTATPFYYQTAVTTSENLETEEWYRLSKNHSSSGNISEYGNIRWFTKRVESQNNQYIIASCNSIAGGLIAVGFKINQIEEFLSGTSAILIVDENGMLIYGRNIGTPGENLSNESYVQHILSGDSGQLASEVGGEEYLITFSTLDTRSNNSWKIASLVPSGRLTANADVIRRIILLTVIACIAVAALLSLLIARSITEPIRVLAKTMHKVREGNLDITLERQSMDEIGELYTTFNKMLRDIKALIKEIYSSQRHLKEIEIKFLQSQINPHFLYNTLNTIKWIGIIHKVPAISQITTDLVKLLRNSIGKEGYMITVEGEIENLHSYICIQQARYNDAFQIHYDIEEEILGLYVYKLILQPLVENSINYAFSNRKDKNNIGIKGCLEDKKLIFEVWDDGYGFDETQFKDVIEALDSGYKEDNNKEKFSGIGLKNIQDRIRMSYGNEYGLMLNSIPGKGSKVTLKLPVIRSLDMGGSENQ